MENQPFFRKHIDQLVEFALEAPVKITPEGSSRLSMSQSVFGAQGDFIGVVEVSVRLSDFQDVLASDEFGGFEKAVLFDWDHKVLSVWPSLANDGDNIVGKPIANLPGFHGLASPEEMTPNQTLIDADGRFFAAYKVADFPLYIGLIRSHDDILTGWREQYSKIVWTIVVIIIGASLLLAFALKRMMVEKEQELTIRRLHTAVEQSPVNIVITDTKGTIQYVNPSFCQATHYEKEEVIGKNPKILKTGNTPPEVYREMWQTISHGGEWNGEFLNRKKNGELFWESANISPIRDQNGKITSYLGVKVDITKRKQADHELKLAMVKAEAAAKAKAEFLASMSHEIRTPMTGVMGFADLLLEDDLAESSREKVFKIKDATLSLLAIINDILDISKMEAGKMAIEKLDFHLPAEIEKVLSLFEEKRHGHREKPLTMDIVLSDDFPTAINSDPTRFRQILVNLVGNAVKFTKKGGITIKGSLITQEGEQFIKIEVRDTGIGIMPDTLDRLFTDFTQADASITRRFEGTGLGLSICKRLVTMLHGQIGVDSSFGEGSTFWFTLPYVAATTRVSRQTRQRTSDYENFQTTRSLHLLIAEDNHINQQILKAMAFKLGHTAEVVDNGQEAVNAHQESHFDLILSDVRMPVMSGPDAARAIRSIGGSKAEVPIIALTADAVEEHKAGFIDSGMNEVVIKPVDLNELTAAINRVMDEEIHLRLTPALKGEDPADSKDAPVNKETMETVDAFLSKIEAGRH